MRITIVGAGSVGLALGARLARSGAEVVFAVRKPDVADQIQRRGVELIDPASGQRWRAGARAMLVGDIPASPGPEHFLLVCTRAPDLPALLADLPAADTTAVSAQNDLDNEEALAQRFPRVLGLVVRHTCTRVGPRAVRALAGGRLVVGAHPSGAGPDVEALADALREGGFDVGVSQRIREDRWLKLCMNLMSAPNALVRRGDHASLAFVETKAKLLEEARDALAAAGVATRSCDGRDRSLDDEIEHQRASLARGTSARDLPLYNAVWTALRSGAPLEADAYHARVIALARENGIATPVNERVLDALHAARAAGRGPERCRAEDLLPG